MTRDDFSISPEIQADLAGLRKLSDEINAILKRINTTYENQKEGYSSANSAKMVSTMQECAARAKKISDNITTIERAVESYRKQITETDEA